MSEQNGGASKHRACDECRSRKLACSKEADGCARCKREGMVCHYSPQKPMGRPRKRPRDESNETASAESANKNLMVNIPLDTQDPGLAFLSFLSGGDVEFDPSLPADVLDGPQADKAEWGFGYTGNDFGQLNFDTSIGHAPSFSSSNIDPALFVATDTLPESVPRLSPGASSSPSSSDSSPPVLGPTNCACTASLYLAIESMQKLPNDVTAAVQQARFAAKAAYGVVNCSCGIPIEAPTEAPAENPQAMHHFQTLMLLATLIPSIVHAYQRILSMVDRETAQAQADRREIAFTLQYYGGVWGPLGRDTCGVGRMLDYKMMEPTIWRLTVRALLRVDVYGISNDCGGGGPDKLSTDPLHLGLSDIVTQMENRSKVRHAVLDAMILSGAWQEPKCVLKMHKTGETPTCQRIIRMARSAIDNLVIA
ncbi:hypothetical protein BJ170DRAFT_677588 [Xylariales sp. AK1849]|nr:hypothetical protein BJ170DRAFT_677588 [Xylariales sp. AK1849]